MSSSISAIRTLFTNDIISYDTHMTLIKRVERLEAKEESRKLVQGTAEAIIAIMNADIHNETKFFSVKKTSNSTGLLGFIETDRATVLKALTQLVADDQIKKVGLVGGVLKLSTEVNAFQIRYMRV